MLRRFLLNLVLVALPLAAVIGPALAHADDKTAGEVLIVLAKEAPGAVDEKLKKLPALQKPPFNAFGSMELLATHAIELSAETPATVTLPNGRMLMLKLVERMPDGRHKVQVSINLPDKQDYLPLLTVIASGEPFFVAGQKHAGGTLVIGVKVGGKASK